MIRDRGTKKWQGFFMPEHVAAVKEELLNEKKITKPILDSDKKADMDTLIHEGMEYNYTLKYKVYKQGFVEEIVASTVYIDYLNRKFRVQNQSGIINYIPFDELIDVERI